MLGVHIICGMEMFGLTVPKAPAKATPAAADDDIFAEASVKTNPVKAAPVDDEVGNQSYNYSYCLNHSAVHFAITWRLLLG